MAEYRITRWRDIPSMVTARDAGGTAKAGLPDRFQEAIDAIAMRVGAAGTDDYLAGWTHGDWLNRDGSAGEVAGQVAAELDRDWSAERLAELLEAARP
ncbi:MAG TPA: virulence factor [Gaiellales bacterium]|nr:virulence factor [Gaiellales bacterium]